MSKFEQSFLFCTTSDMNIFSKKLCLAACLIACTGHSDRFAVRFNLQSFARSRSTAIDGDRGSRENIDQNSTGTLCFVFNVLCGVCINGGGKGEKKKRPKQTSDTQGIINELMDRVQPGAEQYGKHASMDIRRKRVILIT